MPDDILNVCVLDLRRLPSPSSISAFQYAPARYEKRLNHPQQHDLFPLKDHAPSPVNGGVPCSASACLSSSFSPPQFHQGLSNPSPTRPQHLYAFAPYCLYPQNHQQCSLLHSPQSKAIRLHSPSQKSSTPSVCFFLFLKVSYHIQANLSCLLFFAIAHIPVFPFRTNEYILTASMPEPAALHRACL